MKKFASIFALTTSLCFSFHSNSQTLPPVNKCPSPASIQASGFDDFEQGAEGWFGIINDKQFDTNAHWGFFMGAEKGDIDEAKRLLMEDLKTLTLITGPDGGNGSWLCLYKANEERKVGGIAMSPPMPSALKAILKRILSR